MFIVVKFKCADCGEVHLRTLRWEEGLPLPLFRVCDSCIAKQRGEVRYHLKGDYCGVEGRN